MKDSAITREQAGGTSGTFAKLNNKLPFSGEAKQTKQAQAKPERVAKYKTMKNKNKARKMIAILNKEIDKLIKEGKSYKQLARLHAILRAELN